METGVYRRFDLPEELQRRTITGGQAVNDFISMKLLEVMAVAVTAYVMVDKRRDRLGRRKQS